ncbi:hypothetical protein KR018_004858, partial [Drosophila ironensis]
EEDQDEQAEEEEEEEVEDEQDEMDEMEKEEGDKDFDADTQEEEEESDPDTEGDSSNNEKETARHPYPTPPPDENSKMPDPAVPAARATKKKKASAKGSILTAAMVAIDKLANRSGSSVRAIMTYLKANGHKWEDDKRYSRLLTRTLKLGVAKGQLKQVKLSFKLSEEAKKNSKAVEKMKAKKLKDKEREAAKKMKVKAKEQEKKKQQNVKMQDKKKTKTVKKDTKSKSQKADIRKTKQPAKKGPKAEEAKHDPPMNKNAALVSAQAYLETPKSASAGPKKKARVQSETDMADAGKSKKPRKSIGTLAQTKSSKPSVKAVKKMVSAKTVLQNVNETGLIGVKATSTPNVPLKGKRKRKQ